MAPPVCSRDHMRIVRTPLALLAAAALAAPATAAAIPSGSSLDATSAASRIPLGAKLEACSTDGPAGRYAIFKGTMPSIGQAGRMEMRFDLFQRPVTRGGWTRVQGVDSFGEWDLSDTDVSGFIVKKRVGNLAAGAAYRAVVRYRWRDARGRIVRHKKRVTPPCAQPDTRPDLVVRAPEIAGGRRSDLVTYRAFVVNRGRGPAGQFNVVFEVNGAAQPVQRVGPLGVGDRALVTVQGPRCLAGTTLQVTVDSSGEVDETNEDDNVLERPCPAGG